MDVDAPPLLAMKALAEPMRWRIVELLGSEELCVCHLTEELEVPQPLVSHHLRVLRDAALVDSERFRYWTYYRLRTETLAQAGQALLRFAEGAPARGERRRPCC